MTDTRPAAFDQAVVASYGSHADAEAAVRRLFAGGLPVEKISTIGRNFESHEDIQGFYRPADAALDGAGTGAWFGGIFGLMMGAMGFFVIPNCGAADGNGTLLAWRAGAPYLLTGISLLATGMVIGWGGRNGISHRRLVA